MASSASPLLKQFKSQVTDQGSVACLPRELSSEWLRTVLESTEILLAGEDDEKGAIALAAVFVLMAAKGISREKLISDEIWLQSIVQDYGIELALETVHRRTEIRYQPATLETIFAKRDVHSWREVEVFQ